jgi:5,10-methylenetetrahydromethanopterin reductase
MTATTSKIPTLSCAFAPALDTPEHIAVAEQLGYCRAWCYDSPAVYADPWMTLARAAERTSSIGLGPAALVPSLRHPLVNAAALATLAGLAPGRVSAAFGTGLTGRMLLGQRPLRWAEVVTYVRAVQALLHGEDAEWEGQVVRLLQPDGFAAARPVGVALLIAADGPKGSAIGDELGAELFASRAPKITDGRSRTVLTFGTVLDDGESSAGMRVVAAAGPAVAAAVHAIYEAKGARGVEQIPGGRAWRTSVETVDPARRHLAIHGRHLLDVTGHDEILLAESVSLLPSWTTTGSRTEVRRRLVEMAASGVTEVAYQPMGPHIERELTTFAAAALDVT